MTSAKRIKLACYSMNVAMAVVGNLPPLLFVTFHNQYGISYWLLGLLVLINFSTQLAIDLIFTFYSHKFNIEKTVKITPILTVLGFLIFTLWPTLFADYAYIGLVIGTIVFSASSGLAEVLLNPVIASLPSDNTERDLSMLHSIYAWGAVGVVIIGTVFIRGLSFVGWQLIVILMSLVPLVSFFLYRGTKINVTSSKEGKNGLSVLKNPQIWVCALAIFLGGGIECTMAQWFSGYSEIALGIPKIFGDIFGVAVFSMMLGLGRTLYTKYGKNIERVLLLGVCGSLACYLIAALSGNSIVGLIACALTGLCASMLWPGSIIAVSDRVPDGGVLMFALMAAGGDLGASVGPEIVGVFTDIVSANERMLSFASELELSGEQLGMRCGLLIGALFSLIAIPLYIYIYRTRKTVKSKNNK